MFDFIPRKNLLSKYSQYLFQYSLLVYLLLAGLEKFYKDAISHYFNYQFILILTVIGGAGLIFFGVLEKSKAKQGWFGLCCAVLVGLISWLKMRDYGGVGIAVSGLISLYIIYLTFNTIISDEK